MQITPLLRPSGRSFIISALNRRSASFSSPQDLTGARAFSRVCSIHVAGDNADEKPHILLYHSNLVVLSFKMHITALLVMAGPVR